MSWLDSIIAHIFRQSGGGGETAPSELWAELCAMQWPSVETLAVLAIKVLWVSLAFFLVARIVDLKCGDGPC